MYNIVLRALLGGDNSLEFYNLTNLGGVFFDPAFVNCACACACDCGNFGILPNILVNARSLVFLINVSRRLCRCQTAQSAQRGVNQIVAEIKIGEFQLGIAFAGYFLVLLKRGDIRLGIGQSRFGKVGSLLGVIFNGNAVFQSHIALLVLFKDVLAVASGHKIVPIGCNLVGKRRLFRIEAFQIKHFVDGVSLIFDRAFDGDASLGIRGASGCRQCGDDHGKNHDQNQQDAGQFLSVFHMLFSFLS